MTVLVGIKCTDGVVIGADSSATFSDGQSKTIEQPIHKKISIIGEQYILAGTGYVGHHQRFVELVEKLHSKNAFSGKTASEIAAILAREGINDFASTHSPPGLYSAMVCYPAKQQPALIELGGQANFQPEQKELDGLWFSSMGSGQMLADPFLALFREVFWQQGPPNVRGGIFTAYWALKHACNVNTGGIKEPIHIAILSKAQDGKYKAKELSTEELSEHASIVEEATRHFAAFKEILEGKNAPEIPKPNG
jgi:ATP-dependent protease HslVU (ClpYQ) peptidase subunit